MNKKIIPLLTISCLSSLAVFAAGYSLRNKNGYAANVNASTPTYSYTFDKTTWNGDYSENSLVTSQGAKLSIEPHGTSSGDVLFGGEIDGIASIKGNGSQIRFLFPFQRITKMMVVYEEEVDTKLSVKYGTSVGSLTNNGGTLTSGTERDISYYSANQYITLEYYVNIASTERAIVKSITVTYTCA